MGITEQPQPERASWKQNASHTHLSEKHKAIPLVVSYSDIGTADLAKNKSLEMNLSQLKQHKPGLFDLVIKTPQMKTEAIKDRAITRAFEGAPPVIPHLVADVNAQKCLICHGQGIQIGNKTAGKMSHARFSNCVQCHVPQQSQGPFESPALTPANHFVGVSRPGPGLRAHATAPPAVPHPTFMREDCMSCHGLLTKPGLRTTHPWFTNCLQCHAPNAKLDQYSFANPNNK